MAEFKIVFILTCRSNLTAESLTLSESGSSMWRRCFLILWSLVGLQGAGGEEHNETEGFFLRILFDGLVLSCLIAWLTLVKLILFWLLLVKLCTSSLLLLLAKWPLDEEEETALNDDNLLPNSLCCLNELELSNECCPLCKLCEDELTLSSAFDPLVDLRLFRFLVKKSY